jgi:hypothetical protein
VTTERPPQRPDTVAALVRAIRCAYGSPHEYGGLEAFHVHNIHEFARRLAEQGVRVEEQSAA